MNGLREMLLVEVRRITAIHDAEIKSACESRFSDQCNSHGSRGGVSDDDWNDFMAAMRDRHLQELSQAMDELFWPHAAEIIIP
jgi:hypothetical protein